MGDLGAYIAAGGPVIGVFLYLWANKATKSGVTPDDPLRLTNAKLDAVNGKLDAVAVEVDGIAKDVDTMKTGIAVIKALMGTKV